MNIHHVMEALGDSGADGGIPYRVPAWKCQNPLCMHGQVARYQSGWPPTIFIPCVFCGGTGHAPDTQQADPPAPEAEDTATWPTGNVPF